MDLLDLSPKIEYHNNPKTHHFFKNIASLPPVGLIKNLHVPKIRKKHVTALFNWLDLNPQIENLNLRLSEPETIYRFINYIKNKSYLSLTIGPPSRLKLDLNIVFCNPDHLQRLVLQHIFLAEPEPTRHLVNFVTHSRDLQQLFLYHCDLYYTFKDQLAQALEQSRLEWLRIISCKIVYPENFNENSRSLLNVIAHGSNLRMVDISDNNDRSPNNTQPENVISVANKLTSLTLSFTQLNKDACRALASILNLNRVTYLQLNNIFISPSLENNLTDALARNDSIIHLNAREINRFAIRSALIFNNTIAFLEIDDPNMTHAKFQALADMIIEKTSIQRLRFGRSIISNQADNKSIEVLANALKCNHHIKHVEFYSCGPLNNILMSSFEYDNSVEYLELVIQSTFYWTSIEPISRALKHNSTLKILKINYYGINCPSELITEFLAYNSTLEVFEISQTSNPVRRHYTCGNLFEVLKHNSTLRVLKLPLSITSDACHNLATSLCYNQTLEYLHLDRIETFDPLFEALKYNSTLIVFSAVSCHQQYISEDPRIADLRMYNPRIKLKLGNVFSLTNMKSPKPLTKISANRYIASHRYLPIREIIPDEVANHLQKAVDKQGLFKLFQ